MLTGSGYALLRTPTVQTFLTQRIAAYLSHQLKTKVEVQGVDIEFFKKLVLQGFYVEDLHHDTLLYAEKLKVDIRGFYSKKKKLDIKTIQLNTAKFYLKQYSKDSVLNLQFILDEFASTDTTDTTPSKWKLNCSNLELVDVSFLYRDFNEQMIPYGMDYSNIQVNKINGSLKDIKIYSDTIITKIENFSLVEKSGFFLKNFSANTILSAHEISCKNLLLLTENTAIHGDYSMHYNTFSDFLDYNNKVVMKGNLHDSKVSFIDIAYFAPYLTGMNQTVDFSGEAKGTVNQLKGKNLHIAFGNKTKFIGNVNIKGLPDIDNTFIDLIADDFQTTKSDLEKIPVPPFDAQEHLSLPDNISTLGLLTFQGRYTGFFTDFVAFGNFTTALGNFTSDINLKYDDKSKTPKYSGNIAAQNFHIGRFLSQKNYLGRVTLNAKVEGSGLSKDKLSSMLTGIVSNIDFNKYNYKNIQLSGQVANKLFKGTVNMKEEDIDLIFNGSIDFTKKLPVFDFTSTIQKAKLKKLNLLDRDSSSLLSTTIKAHFVGDKLDEIDGILEVRNTLYSEKADTLKIKNLQLEATTENKEKDIKLTSDIADATIKGMFTFSTLGDVVQKFIGRFIPALTSTLKAKKTNNESIDFTVYLKNTNTLSKLFFPKLYLDSNSKFSGILQSEQGSFSFKGTLPAVHLNTMTFKNILINSSSAQDILSFKTECTQLFFSDSVWIDNVNLNAQAKQDSVKFHLQLANNKTSSNKADINGILNFRPDLSKQIKLFFSSITLDNAEWKINETNSVSLDNAAIHINDFVINNGEQSLKINGLLHTSAYEPPDIADDSTNTSERINLLFSKFNLKTLNPVLQTKGMTVGGEINGLAFIGGNVSKLKFSSDLAIANIAFNGDTLGNAHLNSSLDTRDNALVLIGNIHKGTINTFELTGKYALAKEKENLDFKIMIQKTYLQKFARYVDDYIGDLKGIASADLHLSGDFSAPVFTGKITLQKTSFNLKYLNTFYNFADEIIISENSFDFNNLTVNDRQGNKAIVNGKVFHKHFRDFYFDVKVQPRKFQCLNTTASQNSLYYGTAYATGTVKIKGTLDNIVMDIAAKTEKGTLLSIPLSNPEEVSQNNFISFISHDTTITKSQDKYQVDLSGIQLNMDLEATPDAEVRLIFDSKIGDIIKGKGNGNIKMEINSQGTFAMFGDYAIESGDYLFSLKNIINKYFQIEKGGTIKWSGVPYEADINLVALYKKQKASLYDFLPGLVDSSYKRPIPYECQLYMTGKLLNPNIKFGLNIPSLAKDETTLNLFKKYTATEDEINNQVMSLLAFNRFARPRELDQTANKSDAVSANASELLSNQLTNWASQISNKFDFGVNYRAGDASGKSEMEVALSKQFFNDRILVDGTVGVVNNNQSASNLVGDINIEAKLTEDGKIRVRTYNKSNANNLMNSDVSPYTQGVGISYRKDFNSFKELFARKNKKIVTKADDNK